MVKTDKLGWSVGLPCLNCKKYDCPGSVSLWLPNKKGNVKDGLTKTQALKEAKETQQSRKQICNMLL